MTAAAAVRNAVGSVIVAAVLTSCSSSAIAPSQTGATPATGVPAGDRVLFIGNSLTEANGLPAMVAALSRQGGGIPINTASVGLRGIQPEKHLKQGKGA